MGEEVWFYGVVKVPPNGGGKAAPDSAVWPCLRTDLGEAQVAVYCVTYRELAGLVSRPPMELMAGETRALSRALTRHMQVLDRVIESTTVLPATGGVICTGEALIERLLAPRYDPLRKRLQELEGKVEGRLRADYDRDLVLAEVLKTEPSLAVGPMDGYEARIAKGRQISEAIEWRKENDARQLLARIEPLVDAVVLGRGGEAVVLNISVLVRRAALASLDELITNLEREFEMIRWRCIWPLAPYSFVRDVIRTWEETWV